MAVHAVSADNPQTTQLLESTDWSATPLGPREGWPPELAVLVKLMLRSKSPQHIVWGPEYVFLYNDGNLAVLGDRHPAAFGRSFKDVWSDIWDRAEPAVLQTYAGTASFFENDPWLIDRGAGPQQAWFSFTYTPVDDASGKVLGFHCNFHETTAAVLAAQELQVMGERASAVARAAENEQARLNALLQAAPVGIGYAEPDGQLNLVNQANFDLWGQFRLDRTVAEYDTWKGWWADGSPRHGQPLAADDWGLARALRGEDVPGDIIEIEPFDAPGTRKTVLLRATPVRNAAGEVAGGVVVQVDISERVAALARLRESEARFHTITDAMPQMVWSTRPDGSTDYHNRQWHEFTGQVVGVDDDDDWIPLIHPDDRELVGALWARSVATGDLYETQYRLRHHSGEYRWVLVRALPVRDEAGQIQRWMGTCTDIHQQRLAREALEHSQAALLMADHRKNEFLAMLAHELRNPLAPIRTAADVIAMPRTPPDLAKHAGQVIVRQVGHMTKLIDDLLDVSRVTRGLIELDFAVFDLREAVHAAVEQVRPLAEARSHALAVRLGGAPLWVDGERTRLTQVIANLLNNAVKYTPAGGTVSVEGQAVGEQVRICVRDNGEGVEAGLLPHVFELFTQGSRSVDRSQGGLGIGLALVQSLVRLHGGSVHVASRGAGQGSEFTVLLPLAAAPSDSGKPHLLHAADSLAANPLAIVVVDDNLDAANTLALLLQSAGHQVSVFDSGEDTLAYTRLDQTDVCILDIGLPGMDGLALARHLRAMPGGDRLLLFALSGYGGKEDHEASLEAGFDAHFVKPIDGQALLATLSHIVPSHVRAGAG